MDDQNKNLLLATALSMVVILVWFLLFPPPEPTEDPNAPVATETDSPAPDGVATAPRAADPLGGGTPAEAPAANAATTEAPRLPLDSARLEGSLQADIFDYYARAAQRQGGLRLNQQAINAVNAQVQ